jgi:hypothetical protein
MALYRVPTKSPALKTSYDIAITTTFGSAAVTLHSATIAGASPEMVFIASPEEALDAGLMIGAPYCITAGTVIIPVVNPTAADVTTAAARTITIVAL